MSTARPTTLSPARPELVTDRVPARRPGWIELVTSGDHKAIGKLFTATALSFGALALVELVLMRVQLIVPDSTIISPEIFDRLLSVYGATAVVFFGIPLALGLIGYVVPLQIGARGFALPRLAQLSYWLYLAGGVTVYASFLYTPPEAGTTSWPPLADPVFSPDAGADAWIVGVGLAVLGFVLFAINLVATLHNLRAPGMAWRRLPLFSWAAAVSGYLLLVVGTVMLAALVMLFTDRQFDGVFFTAGEGGAPILYQHLSWIFFTGSYMLLLLFAFGAVSEILPTFAGKPAFGYRAIASSFVAIAVLGVLAWMQNMYSAAIPVGWTYMAMAAAVALLVPIGVLMFNWIATLWNGALRIRAAMLFALGAISTVSFGLAGELAYSLIPVGRQLGSTMAAWQDTHYALIGGAVLGGFAALFYWFPKITGRAMGEGLGKASFWVTLVGVHVTLFPMFLAGLEGQVVDAYEYFEGTGVSGYNLVSSLGSFVLAAGILITLGNAAYSARNGRLTGHDPWGAATLEWYVPSPPPEHNFDVLPDVRSAEPLLDMRRAIEERDDAYRPPQALRPPAPVAREPAPSVREPAAPTSSEPSEPETDAPDEPPVA